MIKAPRIYTDNDFDQIQSWLTEREQPHFQRETVPKFGQIIDGVTAGFIIETDNNFAVLDYYCTNPNARLSDRVKGSLVMLERAVDRCIKRGFNYVVAYTKSRGGTKVAQRFGFKLDETPYFIFRRSLVDFEPTLTSEAKVYTPDDFDTIKPWLCDAANEWIAHVRLPKTGFIIDDLACIFLIETDSGVAYVDCFATNKKQPIERRVCGAHEVTKAFLNHAYARGFKAVIGTTRSAKGISLFGRYGFAYDEDPYFFIRRNLKFIPRQLGDLENERRHIVYSDRAEQQPAR